MTGATATTKFALGWLATRRPLAGFVRTALVRRVGIAYAHYVGARVPYYAAFDTGLTVDKLEQVLSRLSKTFEFVPLSVALAASAQHAPDRPQLAVTFDDGFDMTRDAVHELLAAHGIRATSFVLTSTLDNQRLMWRNMLSAIAAMRSHERVLDRYNRLMERVRHPELRTSTDIMGPSLSWPHAEKEELADALWDACDMPPRSEFLAEHRPYFTGSSLATWVAHGHSIGCHTHTHPSCARLGAEDLEPEILAPARTLAQNLGVEAVPFSYPFGHRLPEPLEEGLAESGSVTCALGIRGMSPRGSDPFRRERAAIEGDADYSVFGKALVGLPRAPRRSAAAI